MEKKTPDNQRGFIYNGTTYVPLRFVAESLGQQVRYDGAATSIYLNQKLEAVAGGANVAVVNGVRITERQLYEGLLGGGRGKTQLDNLIDTELVKQEADKKGIVVSDADIAAELAVMVRRIGSEEALNEALKQNQLTVEDLYPDLIQQVRLRKLLQSRIHITDQEVRDYYTENLEYITQPEQVRASHILVETKAEADIIVKELNNGGDFATIAKQKSLDTGSKNAGGDLGYFERGVMDQSFEDAAFSLKVGEISKPVKSEFGYHIILVTDHKAAVTPTFEEEKATIREMLTTEKIYELAATFIEGLRAQAKIENKLIK